MLTPLRGVIMCDLYSTSDEHGYIRYLSYNKPTGPVFNIGPEVDSVIAGV